MPKMYKLKLEIDEAENKAMPFQTFQVDSEDLGNALVKIIKATDLNPERLLIAVAAGLGVDRGP